jgi:hypothetical protein
VILPPLVFPGTVDLLILTSLDQLIFVLKVLFTLFTKQATLTRRSTVLSLPPQLVFPDISNQVDEYRLAII